MKETLEVLNSLKDRGIIMSRLEKIIYVGCPFIFGIVMIIGGIYLRFKSSYNFAGVFAVGFGLICISLYCICALLVKLIEKK